MVDEVLNNEKHIRNSLVQLTKDITGEDFDQLKKKYIKEWRQSKRDMIQNTAMRLTAMAQGKEYEQFEQERKDQMEKMKVRAQKSRKFIVGAIILFIAYKKLF